MKTSSLQRLRQILAAASTALLLAAGATSNAADPAPAVEITELRYLGNASRVTLPELAEDLGYLAPIKLKWLGNASGGPEHLQTLATGEIDFGAGFNGSIVKLAAAGAKLKSVVQYQGSDAKYWRGLYTLDNSGITDARGLIDKKIGVNTLGAAYEFIAREYLKRGGLSDEEIKRVTLVPLPIVNLEQALRQGQIDAFVLSDVFLYQAQARGGIRLLASDYDLFGEFSNASYVFTDKFIAKNPETVRHFVDAVAQAIEWGETTPRDEVVARLKTIINKRNRGENADTADYWLSNGLSGKHGVLKPEFFSAYIDWYVENGDLKPGAIKAEDIYTNAFNRYAN